MGKVEKIVVLSVLFLITLILVVSLSSTPEDPSRSGTNVARAAETPAKPGGRPMAREQARNEGATPTAPATAQPAARPGTLLDSSVRTETAPAPAPAPTTPAPAPATELPAGTVLVSAQGLLPSYLDDYRFYAWRQGDTWESVAAQYFGAGRTALLRRANEGRERVAPGEKILVPVFDLGEPERRSAPAAVMTASAPAGAATPASARPAGGTGYTVEEGDSLWRIAKKVYGEGSRWQAIFDANRDVLPTADDLAPGQTLRIP